MMKLNDAPVAPGWVAGGEPQPDRSWKFHVIPGGRMCSLRRALLLWLIPLFLLVGVASAGFSYWSYQTMVREFMDNQMEQLASSIAMQSGQLMPPPTDADRIHKWGDYVVQVYGSDHTLRHSSWPQLGAHPLHEKGGFQDVQIDGVKWRVFCTEQRAGGDSFVQVYQSGKFRAHLAFERASAALAPILILLPMAFLVLWTLSGAMSRAVEQIGQQAASQDVNSLSELSLEHVPAELKPMVVSFNSLLTRVRDAFATQRRFVQDAAHELRTPITAVALQLENVCRDMPEGACGQSLSQLQQGVSRANRMVDQLLKLSRQEAPVYEPPRAVELHAQVRESISAVIALADQRKIDIGLVEGTSQAPAVNCAAGDLRSALDNLLENAVRYTPEGGVVDVRVLVEGGKPVVEVIDTGPGIPPDLIGRVFDRFFRVPGSQARGSGLGLSIAQAAALRCGLRVTLRNRDDRSGLIARLEPA